MMIVSTETLESLRCMVCRHPVFGAGVVRHPIARQHLGSPRGLVRYDQREFHACCVSIVRIVDVWDSPAVFRADHPFILMIRGDQTGSILFLGRLANPAG
jgi:Serpin (serine protease inhibitor)